LHLGHGLVTNKGQVNDIYGGKYKDLERVNHSFEALGATPDGCACSHPSEVSLPSLHGYTMYLYKGARTPKKVATLPWRLEGYCRVT
jgi:hypothetical protein